MRIPANMKKHYEAPWTEDILGHGTTTLQDRQSALVSSSAFCVILPWSRAVISSSDLNEVLVSTSLSY